MPLFIPSTTKKTTNEEVSQGLRRTFPLWGGPDPGNDGNNYINVYSKSILMDFDKLHYALDAKQPVLNGRGREIRRVYTVKLSIGGVERMIGIVACCLGDAYTVFENVYGKPEPEILEISSIAFENATV
jgi:hypothetical protein